MSGPFFSHSDVEENNETEIQTLLPDLANITVVYLKEIFNVAPGGKSWDEIENELAKGKMLKDIYNLTDDYIDATYQATKEKLEEHDFDGAKELLLNLCLVNPGEPKYWGGLGKCFEGLNQYEEAVECYKMLTLVTKGAEPLPFLCIGFCYLKLNDKINALEILEEGKNICDPYDLEQRTMQEQFDNLISICNQ